MYKRALIILIALFVVIAAVLICVIPRLTAVNVVLSAAKYNEKGEALDAPEITIRGDHLDYLFGADALDIHIAPFDDLSEFAINSKIQTKPGTEICYVLSSASNAATGDVAFFEIGFSPDMDRWAIVNTTDRVYYVGSDSGEYTPRELVEYFKPLIPGSWIADSAEP